MDRGRQIRLLLASLSRTPLFVTAVPDATAASAAQTAWSVSTKPSRTTSLAARIRPYDTLDRGLYSIRRGPTCASCGRYGALTGSSELCRRPVGADRRFASGPFRSGGYCTEDRP